MLKNRAQQREKVAEFYHSNVLKDGRLAQEGPGAHDGGGSRLLHAAESVLTAANVAVSHHHHLQPRGHSPDCLASREEKR